MIALIFVYFSIQQDLMSIGEDVQGEFCRRLNVAAHMVETKDIYDAAAKKWKGDESAIEGFYAFWENIDSCKP